jgi:hypothetical protein
MGLPHNAVKYGERLFSVSAAGMFVHSDNQIKGEGFIIGKENVDFGEEMCYNSSKNTGIAPSKADVFT